MLLNHEKEKKESINVRNITYKYHFEINGQRIKVYKKCFLNTLDETTSFVTEVLKNKNRFISSITRKDW